MKREKHYLIIVMTGLVFLAIAFYWRPDSAPGGNLDEAPESPALLHETSTRLRASPVRSATFELEIEQSERPTGIVRVAEPTLADRLEISARIQPLLEMKHQRPKPRIVEALIPEDEPWLVELYKSERELTNRVALTWALAAVGGDLASGVLRTTLVGDYDEWEVSLAERNAMRDTVEALGHVASRSDSAYQFLLDAVSEDFWALNRSWKADNPAQEAYADERFAKLALASLGATLRPGLEQKLLEFRQMEGRAADNIAPAVLMAAFHYDIARTEGLEVLLEYQLTSVMGEEWRKWRETEYGQEWHAWRSSVRR